MRESTVTPSNSRDFSDVKRRNGLAGTIFESVEILKGAMKWLK